MNNARKAVKRVKKKVVDAAEAWLKTALGSIDDAADGSVQEAIEEAAGTIGDQIKVALQELAKRRESRESSSDEEDDQGAGDCGGDDEDYVMQPCEDKSGYESDPVERKRARGSSRRRI
jgi:hypothetical protein